MLSRTVWTSIRCMAEMTVQFPELQSLETWISTSGERQRAIAEELAAGHGLEFERLAPFRRADLPLASFRGLDGLFRFVLVPGGAYSRGLSAGELALLETRAAAHRDGPDFEQAWGALFARIATMRPVSRCVVAPLLVAQTPLGDFSHRGWRQEIGNFFVGEQGDIVSLPKDLEEGLTQFGFRLPTEREWEWLARGGRDGELTYLGNDVSLDSAYRTCVSDALKAAEGPDDGQRHAGVSNDFGLTAFGLLPEVCLDRYAPTLDAPYETTREFKDRTLRGGAGVAFGQNPGEWHPFLTAYRSQDRHLAREAALRLVRDVERPV
jgi:hypothetical protein